MNELLEKLEFRCIGIVNFFDEFLLIDVLTNKELFIKKNIIINGFLNDYFRLKNLSVKLEKCKLVEFILIIEVWEQEYKYKIEDVFYY